MLHVASPIFEFSRETRRAYVNISASVSSMSSTFFTTNDGDVVLRAGLEPDSKHDFRVHKFILSLASPVFKDMFAFPQPPNQTSSEGHQLPVIDVPERPVVVDALLRLIYPGVEPPKIADLPTLTALLSAADKYNITSIYPVFRATLKTFLRYDPFRAYIVACRFGFSEEAKEAAKVGNTQCVTGRNLEEDVQHISSTDLLRWFTFVQEREKEGRSKIEKFLNWRDLGDDAVCDHGQIGKDFYYRLEKAVEEAFVKNPCMEGHDLFAVLDKVPDPPFGCEPSPDAESGEYYYDDICDMEAFNCPLQPMSIRSNLRRTAEILGNINCRMLGEMFGKRGS